jgi:hypothetical protein
VRKSLLRQKLRPVYRRAYRVTTDSKHDKPIAANILNRRFEGLFFTGVIGKLFFVPSLPEWERQLLVATGINSAFSESQIVRGFWRLPFVIGGLFGFVAMLLRRWLEETPICEAMRRRAALSRELPVRRVLRSHRAPGWWTRDWLNTTPAVPPRVCDLCFSEILRSTSVLQVEPTLALIR